MSNVIDHRIGANLKRRRLQLNMPLEQLVERAGLEGALLLEVEAGATRASAADLMAIGAALGMAPDAIYAGVLGESVRRRASHHP